MLETEFPVPVPIPILLPVPEPLAHGLLVFTFLLHAVFMNLVLGGTPIMVVSDWMGSRAGNDRFRRLALTMASVAPTVLNLTVVLGIVPVFFLYLLYGQFFYPAASLFGNGWIALIGVLLLAYCGLHAYKHWRGWLSNRPRIHLMIGGISAGLFLGIALVFVTLSVLMLNPGEWRAVQTEGFLWAVRLPSVIPRYFHMVMASVAGIGILLVLYGAALGSRWGSPPAAPWPSDPGYPQWVMRYGVVCALIGTLLQIVIGPWLLLTLPEPVLGALVNADNPGAVVFFVSLTFGLLGLVLLNAALMVPRARGFALTGVGSLVVTIALMVVVRDRVRHYWLSADWDPSTLPVNSHWGVIAIFIALLLGSIFLMMYLVRALVKSLRARTE